MAPIRGRPRTDGAETDETSEVGDDSVHALDDLDAALLQAFIAKRVLRLDKALDIYDALAGATGTTLFCICSNKPRVRNTGEPRHF